MESPNPLYQPMYYIAQLVIQHQLVKSIPWFQSTSYTTAAGLKVFESLPSGCVPRSLPCPMPWVGSCASQNQRRMSTKLILVGDTRCQTWLENLENSPSIRDITGTLWEYHLTNGCSMGRSTRLRIQ